jgi:hypothetical protein
LETVFAPLRLAASVQEELEKVAALGRSDYEQYLDALREVAATRSLKQVRKGIPVVVLIE